MTRSQVGNAARSEVKARSVLMSEVCCESIVAMSSSTGAMWRRHGRDPYVLFSNAATARVWSIGSTGMADTESTPTTSR
jgi:hypothetical protein